MLLSLHVKLMELVILESNDMLPPVVCSSVMISQSPQSEVRTFSESFFLHLAVRTNFEPLPTALDREQRSQS
jgi:hypothetical protein